MRFSRKDGSLKQAEIVPSQKMPNSASSIPIVDRGSSGGALLHWNERRQQPKLRTLLLLLLQYVSQHLIMNPLSGHSLSGLVKEGSRCF